MRQVSFGIMIAIALGAGPIIAQQAQASTGVSTGRAKVCRDSKGAAYSTGALLRAPDGSIDRCEEGEWVPAPASATGIAAQQARGQGTQTPQPTPQGQQQPQPSSSMTNVRLALVITDQTGSGQPIKKAISLLLAERGNGRVRSSSVIHPQAGPGYQVSLNADAYISRIEGERIRITVTVEYAPAGAEGASAAQRGSPLNQTVDVVLANGKPTVIVEAADPLTDRKVTLEATATIAR